MSANPSVAPQLTHPLIPVAKGEWKAVTFSFLFFAFLLAGYYVLRPVRDEMGIQGGLKNIQWLFTATFIGMLIIVPLYGQFASWLRRSILVPAVYYTTIACLIFFYFAMKGQWHTQIVPIAFFIWVSVFNYFIVSVFWTMMADIWTNEQAKRLFGFIAAGGSIGAVAGPLITRLLVQEIGVPNMLLVSAALFACSVTFLHLLIKVTNINPVNAQRDKPIGGTLLDGIKATIQSPYLLGICVYILVMAMLATFFYIEQLSIIQSKIKSPEERTALFATLDTIVNTLTLVIQFFVTSQLVRRLGIAFCLALLPALSVVSFLWVGISPEIIAVAASAVARRAIEFAIAKPSREILFTVVSSSDRYKAKNFIDTAVSRGGDMLSGWLNSGLKTIGIVGSTVSFSAIPIAIGLVGLGIWLGKKQEALKSENDKRGN